MNEFVETNTNIFISGESGSGKTWLYEMFFTKKNIQFVSINLSMAISHNSIFTMIEKAVTKSVNKIPKEELLDSCYSILNEKANNKYTYIVLDNLERISSKSNIKEEIITLIQLLEDAEFSKYKIRFVLVGIPSSLKEFFSEIDFFEPIANRISEVSTLNGLTLTELKAFLNDTLVEKLSFDINSIQLIEIEKYLIMITDSMPLKIQQFLLILSNCIINNNRTYNKDLLLVAAKDLLKSHYSEIEKSAEEYFLTPKRTIQRRNQLLFILGKISHNNIFTYSELNKKFLLYFPKSSKNKDLNMNRYISPLTKGIKPLVKKLDKRFRLNDGNVKIWINSVLYIDDNEIVRRND